MDSEASNAMHNKCNKAFRRLFLAVFRILVPAFIVALVSRGSLSDVLTNHAGWLDFVVYALVPLTMACIYDCTMPTQDWRHTPTLQWLRNLGALSLPGTLRFAIQIISGYEVTAPMPAIWFYAGATFAAYNLERGASDRAREDASTSAPEALDNVSESVGETSGEASTLLSREKPAAAAGTPNRQTFDDMLLWVNVLNRILFIVSIEILAVTFTLGREFMGRQEKGWALFTLILFTEGFVVFKILELVIVYRERVAIRRRAAKRQAAEGESESKA